MKKIPSLFQRNYDGDHLVRDEVVSEAEWVIAGEGVATRKWDGTACMVRNGRLYKRYDAKQGKTPPAGWEPCEEAPDPHTGHWPGWVPVGISAEDRWHREAFAEFEGGPTDGDGTYELVGPKVQGNPEKFARHRLIPHGDYILENVPCDYAGIRAYLSREEIEGIVWYHPDGRMAKIKRRDFDWPWPIGNPR